MTRFIKSAMATVSHFALIKWVPIKQPHGIILPYNPLVGIARPKLIGIGK